MRIEAGRDDGDQFGAEFLQLRQQNQVFEGGAEFGPPVFGSERRR